MATLIDSWNMRFFSVQPRTGLDVVGDVAASRPTSEATSSMRAMWYGSDTSTTARRSSARKNRAVAASDSHELRPSTSRRIAPSSTPSEWR
jgi:hypothetical protein